MELDVRVVPSNGVHENKLVVPNEDRSGWSYAPEGVETLEDICTAYPDYPQFFERVTGQPFPSRQAVTPRPSPIELIAAGATPREPPNQEDSDEEERVNEPEPEAPEPEEPEPEAPEHTEPAAQLATQIQTLTITTNTTPTNPSPNNVSPQTTTMSGTQNPTDIKIKMPSDFSGKRSEAKEWLQKCSLYFAFNPATFSTDTHKVVFALMLMKGGTAGPWASDFITQAADQGDNFGKWEDFKKQINLSFSDVDEKASARVALRSLAQGKRTVDEYITEFRNVINRCKITDFDVIADFFYGGLNRPLREKIFTLESMPTTIDGLYSKAAQLENQWRMGKTYDSQRGHKNTTYGAKRPSNQTKDRDPDAMDIDRMTAEERDRHFKEGLCFTCHKAGHLSRNCPEKKTDRKPMKTKVRTTEVEEPDDAKSTTSHHSNTSTASKRLVAARVRLALKDLDDAQDREEVLKEVCDEGF